MDQIVVGQGHALILIGCSSPRDLPCFLPRFMLWFVAPPQVFYTSQYAMVLPALHHTGCERATKPLHSILICCGDGKEFFSHLVGRFCDQVFFLTAERVFTASCVFIMPMRSGHLLVKECLTLEQSHWSSTAQTYRHLKLMCQCHVHDNNNNNNNNNNNSLWETVVIIIV